MGCGWSAPALSPAKAPDELQARGSGRSELSQPGSWDEQAKKDSLKALGVLGRPPVLRLESAISILRSLFSVEIAVVSLIQPEELALVTRAGAWPGRTPAQGSLGEWMLAVSPSLAALTFPGGVVAYEDLSKDPRFAECPFVRGPPCLRFWAGMPLLASTPSGSCRRIGSLCILDLKPRHFEPSQYAIMPHVAEVVVRELEREWASSAVEATAAPPLALLRQPMPAPAARAGAGAGAGAGAAVGAGVAAVQTSAASDQDRSRRGGNRELILAPSASSISTSMLPAERSSSLSARPDSGDSAQGITSTKSAVLPIFQQMRPKVFEEVILGPLVGQGSNGRCYKAMWQGGHVVVKIMDCLVPQDMLFQDPHAQVATSSKGAVVEAVLGRSLAHPHIVSTFDWAVSTEVLPGDRGAAASIRQQVWIIQAYCNRGTLMEAIDRGDLKDASGQPNLNAILRTAQEIAGAMSTLHQHDVLHGDLTCHNILLTSSNKDARRWIPQVADFGLARVIQSSTISTQSLGTVTHMPPELLTEGLLTPAADVYSFGVILWELWMGHRAWKGYSAAQTLCIVSTGEEQLEPLPGAPPAFQTRASVRVFSHIKRKGKENIEEAAGGTPWSLSCLPGKD